MAAAADTQIERLADGRFRICGELTFPRVTAVLNASRRLFAGAERLELDLSAVGRADSAGLALLVQWLRDARGSGRAILFHHVPEQLLAIARISDLEEILPLGDL